jgi:hypothetical protein
MVVVEPLVGFPEAVKSALSKFVRLGLSKSRKM